MEPRKKLGQEADLYKPDISLGPRAYYEKSRDFALKFYPEEVARISSIDIRNVTPEFFFREYVWVVHATGFSAGAVSKFIDRLFLAYGDYNTLASEKDSDVAKKVLAVCNNPAKMQAVKKTAGIISTGIKNVGWDKFKLTSLSSTDKLSNLPYIGKITCFHLGRNIGLLDSVKPDLHLVRLSNEFGFNSCEEMCISMRGDDKVPLGIVDLYLWYTASTFGTINIKKEGNR